VEVFALSEIDVDLKSVSKQVQNNSNEEYEIEIQG